MDLFDMVRMADKIKDCQRAARFLFGAKYPEKAEKCGQVIKDVMESEGKNNPFAAVTHICAMGAFRGSRKCY